MDLSSHGVVALLRNRNGQYLLLKEARGGKTFGLWAPPHGRCKPSDKDEAATIIREVKEETSLTVAPVRKLYTQAADTKVATVSFWLVDTLAGDINLNAESSASGWYSVRDALALDLFPGTKAFFEKVLLGEISID